MNSFAEMSECTSITDLDKKLTCLTIVEKELALESQDSWYSDPIIEQGIVQTSAIIIVIITTLVAWKKERDKPIEQQQVQSFHKYMIDVHMESYLDLWADTWEKLKTKGNTNLDPTLINSVWDALPRKGSEEEKIQDEKAWKDTIKKAWNKAERENLSYITKFGTIDKFEKSIQHLKNIAKVNYYNRVSKDVPDLTSRAVYANTPSLCNIEQIDVQDWKSKSLTSLKILMMLYFHREHEETLRIMVDSEINRILTEQK